MLFRLVRPVKRRGSRFHQFVRRIPTDVKDRVAGLTLNIPVGQETKTIVLSARMQAVRFSLRSDDPAEVKARLATVDAYLENVWRALREDAPISLTHKQATALAGELYRAWADGEGREYKIAIEDDPQFLYPDDHLTVQGPDGRSRPSRWRRIKVSHISADEWEAARLSLERLNASGDGRELEKSFGPLLNRQLLSKGIRQVDEASRVMILEALLLALRDAFASRRRNVDGDYSPDPKAQRFPEWKPPATGRIEAPRSVVGGSLNGFVADWWTEAKARGLKPSTHESYKNTMAAFVRYLGHDDANRVTRTDVLGFKDHRLAAINPRTGHPISAKTVKDSDLAALKVIFDWAEMNGKMDTNPAAGVTIKLGKPRKLRSKAFTDHEAETILTAARTLNRGKEKPKTFAAKRWVPWLCAYTGARVGELAQIRKQDVRHDGQHWILTITPEAGPVKTNEAREVVLHEHLIALGFTAFVNEAAPGHLFITPSSSGDVAGPLQGVKNRIAEFIRTVVPDKNVAPNHGWRHRFKTIGMDAGIEHRILDAIQGHKPRNIAEGYGDVSTKAQAAAIARIPRYKVPT